MKIINAVIRKERICYICKKKLSKGKKVLVFFPFRAGRSYACTKHEGKEIRNAINQKGDARWCQKVGVQCIQETFTEDFSEEDSGDQI